jgi:branched-chain amino acid transport system substrate-binding protein
MSMQKKRITAVAGAAVAVSLLVAACSSSKSSDSGASSGGSASAAEPTGSTLTFGMISADSGPVILSSIADGTEAWAKFVNTHGGLAGHPVKIKRCDDGLDATKNQDCARQMIADTGVLAVIGGETVITPSVAAPLFNQALLGYVGTEPTGAGELTGPAMYAITGGAITQFAALDKYLPANGMKKIALVNASSTSSQASAVVQQKQIAANGGTVTTTVFAKPGTPDYAPIATQLLSTNPDAIITGVTPADLPQLIKAIRQQSTTVKIATLASQWPATAVKAVGDQKDGIYLATNWAPFDDKTTVPQVVGLRDSLKAIDKSDSFGQGAMSGWLGGRTVEVALKNVKGEVTRANLLEALRNNTLTVPGIVTPLSLSNTPASTGYTGLANPSAYVNVWKKEDLTNLTVVKNVYAPTN